MTEIDKTAATQPATRWNRLAIEAFCLPLVTFILARVLGNLLLGDLTPPTSKIDFSQAQAYLSAALPSVIASVIVDIIGYTATIVLGYRSLRGARNLLRGRRFGVAAILFGYLGVALTLLAVIAVAISAGVVAAHHAAG